MTDIVERLRAKLLDRDNFPRMDSEKWLPVGLAKEAADEIEQLRAGLRSKITLHEAEIRRLSVAMGEQADEIERLRAALEALLEDPPPTLDEPDTDAEVIIKMRAIAAKANCVS